MEPYPVEVAPSPRTRGPRADSNSAGGFVMEYEMPFPIVMVLVFSFGFWLGYVVGGREDRP